MSSFDKYIKDKIKADPSLKKGIKKAEKYIDLMMLTYVTTPTFTKNASFEIKNI